MSRNFENIRSGLGFYEEMTREILHLCVVSVNVGSSEENRKKLCYGTPIDPAVWTKASREIFAIIKCGA